MSSKDQTVPEPSQLAHVFDAHTHLDVIARHKAADKTYSATDPVIQEIVAHAQQLGVANMITVADDLASAIFTAEAAQTYPGVYAAVALHPVNAQHLNPESQIILTQLAQKPRVVAIGETGLDWYWAERDEKSANRLQQEESFRWHIELAKQTNKALMIHNRDADLDILRILDDQGSPAQVIFHCFSSDSAMAQACAERGYYLSLSGTVTFKNSQDLQAAAKIIPLDLLLVETDAPFLTPHPYRGRRNEPYCLPYTVRFIADLLDKSAQEIADITNANAHRVYRINE